jgi:hypothetical protein
MVRCGDCQHFTTDFPDLRAADEQRDPETGCLGNCNAMENIELPYAWRYCRREVMGVWSLELIECPRFLATAVAGIA